MEYTTQYVMLTGTTMMLQFFAVDSLYSRVSLTHTMLHTVSYITS